jgi:uncharacterized membrane protein
MGSNRKSFLKAISWRAIGSLDTFLLGLLFTGHVGIAGSIAVTELATKIVLFYLHERVWTHIPI